MSIRINKNRICKLLNIKYPIFKDAMTYVFDAIFTAGMNLNKRHYD